MFPSNSYMDPYISQNKGQIPYPSYPFYPCPVPSRPDTPAQSASYAPWPYQFNPIHSNGYSYPSGYYGPRHPFPYELPPPNFPNYYHPYFTPMLNYPAQFPQVDHTISQSHCCGCPNHVCNGTDSPKMKIDEEKYDVDQRKISNNDNPFSWFSPRNKVQQDESEKQKEKREAQFPWPIVWMPEDEIKEKKKKDTQFPWPIIWMPEDDANDTKHQHANKQASEEAVKPSFRIIPLKFLEDGDKDQAEMQKFPVVEKKQGDEETGMEWRDCGNKDQGEVKKIPVMEKKEGSEKVGKKQPVEESTGDKVMEKKLSKLPPVCLRVDPPPHKRLTNGSSKEEKNKTEVKVVDVNSEKDGRKMREIEVHKGLKEKLQERKIDDVKRGCMAEEDKIKKEIKVVDVRGSEGKELKERKIQGEDLKDKLDARKVESVKRAKISEQDAAVRIQSVYRGYNVRRWDPLEKLKKIRSVHEKAQELLEKLRHVEESGIQLEKKELLVISESIMNLLLQLDTIQGLHPTVRDARKSVARELVSLQEKLDSLEKQNAVGTQTNEVQQPQLEVQPTASTVSSEGCKLVSEQVDLQPSEAPTMECMTTQKGGQKARESLQEADNAVELDQPQSATDFHPIEETLVKNEDDASGTPESQVIPLLGDTEPTNLIQENVELHATEAVPVPTVAEESNTTELAPAVTLFESSTDTSNVLSESEMHDTAVTSSVTEEIHVKEVVLGVTVTDGVNPAATIPEINNLDEDGYVEEVHLHATESGAKDGKEIASEVTLSETTAKEVDLQEALIAQEESHGSDAGASVKKFELQTIEDGKPGKKENKVEDNEIAPDAAVTASPEENYVNDGGASSENVELLATEVDKLKEENKSVEEDEVTVLSGNEETALPENENHVGFQKIDELNELQAEVHPDLLQPVAKEDAPEVEVTDHATEVGKLSSEEKKLVEENEKMRDMLEKLLEAGRNQLDVISGLNERVKGLEKKLERKSKKSKVSFKKHKPAMAPSIKV